MGTRTKRGHAYLAVDFVEFGGGVVEGQEQVVGAPLDEFPDVVVLADGAVLGFVLDDAPAQHRHRERHGEVVLDVLPAVVVPAHEPSLDIR